MFKKINLIISITFIAMFFYGCTKIEADLVYDEIHIFDLDKNIELDFIPDEEILLSELIGGAVDSHLLITNDGEEVLVDEDITIKKSETAIDAEYSNTVVEDIAGIYIGDQIPGISKLYFDIKSSVDKEEEVLAVFLDGFSYKQYLLAREENKLKFLQGIFLTPARSVYTPVTNSGFASMITGTLPPVNGVHDRSYRGLDVESIFGYALKENKKQLLIGGDAKILNTEIEPMLNADANENGDTDDEVYVALLQAMEKEYEFLFVHFQGIYDRSNNYGPYSSETMDYIEMIDEYLGQIDNLWSGKILIISGHGMHKTKDGGDHGECRYEDMIVPYFTRESIN